MTTDLPEWLHLCTSQPPQLSVLSVPSEVNHCWVGCLVGPLSKYPAGWEQHTPLIEPVWVLNSKLHVWNNLTNHKMDMQNWLALKISTWNMLTLMSSTADVCGGWGLFIDQFSKAHCHFTSKWMSLTLLCSVNLLLYLNLTVNILVSKNTPVYMNIVIPLAVV